MASGIAHLASARPKGKQCIPTAQQIVCMIFTVRLSYARDFSKSLESSPQVKSISALVKDVQYLPAEVSHPVPSLPSANAL